MPELVNWRVHRVPESCVYQTTSNYHPPDVPDFMAPFLHYPAMVQGSDAREVFSRALYPKLRHLTLAGFPVNWTHLAADNLRHLDLRSLPVDVRPSYRDLAALLRANAHSLEVLGLQAVSPLEPDAEHPIDLPNVRTFAFGFSHTEIAVALVECLKLPALRCLRIRDYRPLMSTEDSNRRTRFRFQMWQLFCPVIYDLMMECWPLEQVVELALIHPEMLSIEEEMTLEHNHFQSQALEFFNHFPALEKLCLFEPHLSVLAGIMSPIYLPPKEEYSEADDEDDEDYDEDDLAWAEALMTESQQTEHQNEEERLGAPTEEQQSKAGKVEKIKEVIDFQYLRLPCPKLDTLQITTKNSQDLIFFLRHLSSMASTGNRFARHFDRIILGVPSEWGRYLRPVISRDLVDTVVNNLSGYFISGPIEGEQSIMDVVNAAPMPPTPIKVVNLVAA